MDWIRSIVAFIDAEAGDILDAMSGGAACGWKGRGYDQKLAPACAKGGGDLGLGMPAQR